MSLQEAIKRIDISTQIKGGATSLDLSGLSLEILPTEILLLPNLKKIDLRNNQLTRTVGLEDLTKLTSIDFRSNQISKIEGLDNLKNLKTLSFHTNKISKIEGLENLKQLTNLSLERNELSKIEGLDDLANLQMLSLDSNRISTIQGLDALNKLESLYLRSNKIERMQGLENLNQLESLYLGDNQIKEIEGLENLSNLSVLRIWSNQLTKIQGLENCSKLENLSLAHNLILKIENLDGLLNLSTLDISENQILKIENLAHLTQLGQLVLSENKIAKIEGLDKLKRIVSLNLSNNFITRMEGINHLSKLRVLLLAQNQISKIEGLDKIYSLEILNLSDNKITRIDGALLSELKDLKIAKNQISEIKDFNKLQKLENLKINNNPFIEEHGLILNENENHLGSILNFFNRKSESERLSVVLPAKMLLLGNHASGKSSLLHYLQNGNLNYTGDSTHLLAVQDYPKGIKVPKAIFYDFGGQDYYHGIYRTFLSAGSGYILLWTKNTNDNRAIPDKLGIMSQNFSLYYWLGQKKYLESEKFHSAPDPILLVQTHANAHTPPTFIGFDENNSILNTFYVSLNNDFNSPKNESALFYLKKEIDELIESKRISRKEPKWYINFLTFVMTQKDWKPTPIIDLIKMYTPNNLTDKGEILASLEFELQQFHNQGLVLYYPEINKDIVWLAPQSLVQHVHDFILEKEKMLKSKGRLDFNELSGANKQILELLQFQKVVFEHQYENDQKEYIIPNFLPLVSEDSAQFSLHTFGLNKPFFVVKFEHFLPVGIINQLICFFGEQPNEKKFWRDQLLFIFENKCKILIRLDFENLEVKFFISFPEMNLNEQNEIGRYFFHCFMAMYWDTDLLSYDKFIELSKYSSRRDSEELKGGDDFEQEAFDRIYENPACRPQDMYVSRNDQYFVNYTTLAEIDSTQIKIMAYEINENRKLAVIANEVLVQSFEIFTNKKMRKMKKVVISYSKEDLKLVHRFLDALVPLHDEGLIEDPWYCSRLEAGSNWNNEIQNRFGDADIVFFMCSISFVRTKYIREHEIKTVITRKENGAAILIIPVIINFCEWDKYLGDYTALPYTAKPIVDFKNEDLAWYITIKAIRIMLEGKGEDISTEIKKLQEQLVEGKLNP